MPPLLLILIVVGVGAWLFENSQVPPAGQTPPPPPGGAGTPANVPFDPTNVNQQRTDWVPGTSMQIATDPPGGFTVISNHLPISASDIPAIMAAIYTVDQSATWTGSKNPYQLNIYGHRTDPTLTGGYVISALRGGPVRGLSVDGIAVDT